MSENSPKFPNLRDGLVIYDAFMANHTAEDAAKVPDDKIAEFFRDEDEALMLLQKAFYKDTYDTNTWEACKRCGPSFFRRLLDLTDDGGSPQ